jgi:hypothetical protein
VTELSFSDGAFSLSERWPAAGVFSFTVFILVNRHGPPFC